MKILIKVCILLLIYIVPLYSEDKTILQNPFTITSFKNNKTQITNQDGIIKNTVKKIGDIIIDFSKGKLSLKMFANKENERKSFIIKKEKNGIIYYSCNIKKINFYTFIEELAIVSNKKIIIDKKIMPSSLDLEMDLKLENVIFTDMLNIVIGSRDLVYEERKDEYFITLLENINVSTWDIYYRENALEAYQRFIRMYLSSENIKNAQIQIAKILIEKQNYKEALLICKEILNDYNKKDVWENAQYLEASALLKLKEYDKARASAYLVVDGYPKGKFAIEAFFIIAETLEKQKDINQAVIIYNRMLNKFINNSKITAKVNLQMAEMLFRQNDYDNAVKYYSAVLSVDTYGEYRYLSKYKIIKILFNKKEYDKYIECALDFLKEFPLHKYASDISYNIGIAYYNQNKFIAAARSFEYFIKNYKDNKKLIIKQKNLACNAYFKACLYNEAIRSINELLEIEKLSPFNKKELIILLADIYFQLADYKKTRKIIFDEKFSIIKEHEKNLYFKAYLLVGDSYYAEKDYQNACETYNKIIDFKDKSYDKYYLQLQLARSYFQLKDNDSAYKYYNFIIKEIDELQKDVSANIIDLVKNVYYEIGDIFFELKDFNNALLYYEEACKKYPDHPKTSWALYRKAKCMQLLNKDNEALKIYNNIAGIYQGNYLGKQAEWDLSYLDWKDKNSKYFSKGSES